MTLEDFEKSLAEAKKADDNADGEKSHRKHKEHRHHHHHNISHHRDNDDGHRHKRRRRSREEGEGDREHRKHRHKSERDGSRKEPSAAREDGTLRHDTVHLDVPNRPTDNLKRDSWMEAPSAIDFDYVQRREEKAPAPPVSGSVKADFELKIHENELNKHHLQQLNDGIVSQDEGKDIPAQHEVDYVFGDSGSQWRMTKLKAVYRQAEESGQSVEEMALRHYGDFRSFDDAREEEIELDRRLMYGEGYVGKEKPDGELFRERKMQSGATRGKESPEAEQEAVVPEIRVVDVEELPRMDQTALNRLKAQMMKAKLRGAPNAAQLETEYNAAAASFSPGTQADMVVLGPMESRMLTGGRNGEVKNIDNRRGRERGLVEENEDMSIEDMVREERRTRGQAGGEGRRFAERIAKDGKFDVRSPRHVLLTIILTSVRTTSTTWTKTPTSSPSASKSPKSI